MKLSFNRHILSLSVIDSGVITPMMAVIHRFREPGTYLARVLRGDDQVAGFSIVVDRDAPLVPAQIDLGDIQCPATVVNPETHVLFRAPASPEGYSVVVEQAEGRKGQVAFDNRKLGDGDILMAMLFRPGRYIATDERGAKCEISVALPVKGAARYIASQKRGVISHGSAISIEYGKDGFRPGKIEAASAQGLMFMIRAPARIRIAFQEEGGAAGRQQKARKAAK